MPAGQMPVPPTDDVEGHRRIATYAAQARSVAHSTRPAIRRRAEAAIRELHQARGLEAPRILWVPSPLAGAMTYDSLAGLYDPVRDPDAKGDIGTGANAEWNGLADPFPFPPDLLYRLWRRIENRLPSDMPRIQPSSRWPSIGAFEGIDGVASALGLRAWTPVLGELRSALPNLAELATEQPLAGGQPDERRAARFARVEFGADADRFTSLLGAEAFAVVVHASVQRALRLIVSRSQLRSAVQAMQPGQFDWLTPFVGSIEAVFGAPVLRTEPGRTRLQALVERRMAIAESAGPWWALDGLAIVSERPLRVAVDDRDRLHSETGPALAYGDGTAIHAWNGVRVDPWIIDHPERITVGAIDEAENAEVRRVMVERFGAERLVREGNAELVQEDSTGRLWRRPLSSNHWNREEPIVMVEVVNSTPQPDGTRKTYWLRVPPTTETAREGVAWTFALNGETYRPIFET